MGKRSGRVTWTQLSIFDSDVQLKRGQELIDEGIQDMFDMLGYHMWDSKGKSYIFKNEQGFYVLDKSFTKEWKISSRDSESTTKEKIATNKIKEGRRQLNEE